MTTAGYVPAIGETDLNKIIRSIRNLYENQNTGGAATDIFPEQYGAVGDGITDDTSALQSWIAAYDGTQKLRLAPKPYLISGTLNITKPIVIEGTGGKAEVDPATGSSTYYESRIVVASSVNTSTDIFYIKPPFASVMRDLKFKNFRIMAQSGTPGRHAFHFDTSTYTSFTQNTSATTAAGNNVLTFSSTTNIPVGISVLGTNIPLNSYVGSKTSTTITLLAPGGGASNVTGAGITNGQTISFNDCKMVIADVLLEGMRIDIGSGGTQTLTSGNQQSSVNAIFINNGNGYGNGSGGTSPIATGSPQGGVFNLTVRDCYIGGNISILYGGDTLRFEDNIVTNNTVTVTQVLNAEDFIWTGNNCSMVGGLTLYQGIKPIIADNEIEQQAYITQASTTLTTSAISNAGSTTLTFPSTVANQVLIGMIVANITHPTSIPANTTVTAATTTTVTLSQAVASPGVSSGDTISFGGCMIDFAGSTGAIDGGIIRDNGIQNAAPTNNSAVLLRLYGSTNTYIAGNRWGVGQNITAILISSASTSPRFGPGNWFPGGLAVSKYVTDNCTTTVYPRLTYITGTTGGTALASNTTNYLSHSAVNATETNVYFMAGYSGRVKNLSVVTTAVPGGSNTYVFTVRHNQADTVVTVTIPSASNSAQDISHYFDVSQQELLCLKAVTGATANACNATYIYELHSWV